MNIEIANRLVDMRKKHDLSQEELANRLGISRQAVSKWERAEASPDTDNLILLARLYGVSLDELLMTNAPDEAVREDAAAAASPEWKPTEDDVVRMVREAWRQGDGPQPQAESQTAADPFQAEPPHAPEPPRDAFTGETPAWGPAPDAVPPMQPEWPNAVPTQKPKTLGQILRSLRGVYPILCLFVFLFMGFFLHIWHPTWMVFLTTPIFYVLADKLE